MTQGLNQKVVAVTGAASGIGLECAKTFLNAGARVVLIDYAADKLEEICTSLGPNAVPLVVNLTDPVNVNGMMPRLLEKTGQLDIFHANAGSYVGGEVLGGDPDAWDRMLNLNAIAGAVIGGTSLFGGRGSAYSALLGIIVIGSIASGLTLLDLSSSLRYMITGAVLAIAVVVDSLARRSRVSHGRA